MSLLVIGATLPAHAAGRTLEGPTTTTTSTTTTTMPPYCGNQITENGEQCDDGGTVAGDGCSCVCLYEYCGNAILDPTEQCDDGNTDNLDGCNEKCQIVKPPLCGNNKIEEKEQCDDGNTASGDGCNADCNFEYCGDGVVNNDQPVFTLSPRHVSIVEECDDGNTESGDGCTADCLIESCGDGVVNGLEQCDDGNNTSNDGCDSKCQAESCGDAIVNGTEQCDDGGTAAGDGCNATCNLEYCGDSVVNNSGEQCDDGGTATGDGCDANCVIEIPTGACCTLNGCVADVSSGDCDSLHAGTYAGDNTICGDPGICSVCGNGRVETDETCDDGNVVASDGCDETCAVEICWTCAAGDPSVCTPDNTQSCDDGDECTLGDACVGGSCSGNPPVLPAACRWVMVGGDDQRDVQSRTRDLVNVTGDICGESTRVGESSLINGDVVATRQSGLASSIYAFATINGDVVTGGGSITGKPNGTILPGLAVAEVAAGTMAVQSGNPDYVLDARGGPDTDPRVLECEDAIAGIDPAVSLIDSLTATDSRGDVRLDNLQTLTIVASNPGGLNVIDFERITTGNKTTLILDGGGDPATTFILRVRRKLYLRFQSQLQLTNGASPEHVLLYGAGLCKFGEDVVGGGTVLCPHGKLSFVEHTIWNGALIAGRQYILLRHKSEITHVPLLIGAP